MCMSIVASAFQYGCAPTLMPVTTTLISPPRLRELDDPPQHRRDPVHVLGAGVHRDLGAGGDREPLDRHAEPLGEVERGDDARHSGSASEPSPRVGSPSSATRSMPSGWRSVALRISPTTMLGGVRGGRPVDRDELAVVEVVLLEVAVEQLHDLGRVHEPTAARGDDPLRAGVERLDRLRRRVAELDGDAAAGRVEHAQHAVLGAEAQPQLHELEPDARASCARSG